MLQHPRAWALALFCLASPVTYAMNFESCTPNNSYLEEKLPTPAPEPPSRLPAECIQRAQLNLPAFGYYGYCPTAQGAPSRTHPRPCVSQKYVSAVHSTLLDVSECFGYDIKWAFAAFNLESALHLTAVGASSDVGIGQLTKVAIEQVNNKAIGPAYAAARLSSIPACWRLTAYIKPFSGENGARCGFMSLPENPKRNLIFSVLLIQQNRKLIEKYFKRDNINLPASVDQERLKQMMTKLAYNSGAAGLAATLKAYVTQMGSNLTGTSFHFENFQRGSYAHYLSRHFPSTSGGTKKRVSKYMSYVINSVRKVDAQVGVGRCLDRRMFPPLEARPFEQPEPDPQEAEALVQQYLQEYADDYLKFKAKSAKECEELRNDFEFEFVPQGETPKDLPAPIYERYQALCD